MNVEVEIIGVLNKKIEEIDIALTTKQANLQRLELEVNELQERKHAISLVIEKEFKTNGIVNNGNGIGNILIEEVSDSSNNDVDDKQPPAEHFIDTGGEIAQNSSNGGQPSGHKPRVPKRRRRGLLNTARENFDDLPQVFTKYDVVKILVREHPELNGTMNDSSLRGVLGGLAEQEFIKIKIPAQGIEPQVYEKI
jgi:hypothetical protein